MSTLSDSGDMGELGHNRAKDFLNSRSFKTMIAFNEKNQHYQVKYEKDVLSALTAPFKPPGRKKLILKISVK